MDRRSLLATAVPLFGHQKTLLLPDRLNLISAPKSFTCMYFKTWLLYKQFLLFKRGVKFIHTLHTSCPTDLMLEYLFLLNFSLIEV